VILHFVSFRCISFRFVSFRLVSFSFLSLVVLIKFFKMLALADPEEGGGGSRGCNLLFSETEKLRIMVEK
jgi:hypothetical protein